jgi:hypothetical protein
VAETTVNMTCHAECRRNVCVEGKPARTVAAAQESAAWGVIHELQSRCGIQVKDTNWENLSQKRQKIKLSRSRRKSTILRNRSLCRSMDVIVMELMEVRKSLSVAIDENNSAAAKQKVLMDKIISLERGWAETLDEISLAKATCERACSSDMSDANGIISAMHSTNDDIKKTIEHGSLALTTIVSNQV